MDSEGNVYVADSFSQRIQTFDVDGDFLKQWGTEGSGDGEFNTILDIDVDYSGTIFVADSENNRIQYSKVSTATIFPILMILLDGE